MVPASYIKVPTGVLAALLPAQVTGAVLGSTVRDEDDTNTCALAMSVGNLDGVPGSSLERAQPL